MNVNVGRDPVRSHMTNVGPVRHRGADRGISNDVMMI